MTRWTPFFLAAALIGCGDKDSAGDSGGADDTAQQNTDLDGDGFEGNAYGGDDCDDSDPNTYPGADEYCDGLDNDCDGQRDEDAVDATRYVDADGDGYGQDATIESCSELSGTAEVSGDCDDVDPRTYPDADEVCDGNDNDCDGLTDEEDDDLLDATTYYTDADLDGFADQDAPVDACEISTGLLEDDGSGLWDCDDSNGDAYPGAALDDSFTECMADADGDGYGDANASGDVVPGSDCDDSDAATSPDGIEICDDADNDCNGFIDDDAIDATTAYPDVDGDGYGDADGELTDCDIPTSYIPFGGDCDDSDAAVYPGAEDTWYDGVDGDCAGDDDYDADGDGFQSDDYAGTDCDDADADVNTDAEEVCDEVDNDCDGTADIDATDADTVYADADGDGYGDANNSATGCGGVSGYVDADTDCDDTDDTIHPFATEDDCSDSTDYNCDGSVGNTDNDADGYDACEGDCDDSDSAINEDATEICDGVDNDCDPTTSEDGTLALDGAEVADITTALVSASSGSTITLCAGTWSGNWEVRTDVTIEGASGAEETILDGSGSAEAVLSVNGATLTLEGLTISGGSGDYESTVGFYLGGGINAWNAGGELTITDCVIEDNDADYGGGIMGSPYGTIVTDSIIQENTCSVSGAGGYMFDAEFTDSQIINNDADQYSGGLMTDSSTLTFTDTTISGNTATELGGGILLNGSTVSFDGGAVTDNYCVGGIIYGGGLGGGIHMEYAGTLTVDGTEVSGNTSDYGAGLFMNGGDATLTDAIFEENTATYGGGAFIQYDSTYGYGDATMESVTSDWGSAAGDNDPDDVDVEGTVQYSSYGTSESFTCESATTSCY